MASDSPLVGIIIGSQSDLDVMRNASETLDNFGIANEMKILYDFFLNILLIRVLPYLTGWNEKNECAQL